MDEIIKAAGGVVKLADIAEVDHSTVIFWRRKSGRVPVARAILIANRLGIPRSEIRPDIWEPAEASAGAEVPSRMKERKEQTRELSLAPNGEIELGVLLERLDRKLAAERIAMDRLLERIAVGGWGSRIGESTGRTEEAKKAVMPPAPSDEIDLDALLERLDRNIAAEHIAMGRLLERIAAGAAR